MLRFVSWVLLPLVVGLAIGALSYARSARACECVGDGFWVLKRRTIAASDASVDDSSWWPSDGHVYPGRMSLWGPGQRLELEYGP